MSLRRARTWRLVIATVAGLAVGCQSTAPVPTSPTPAPNLSTAAAMPSQRGSVAGPPSTATSALPSAQLPIALDPDAMDAKYAAALPLFAYDTTAPLDLELDDATESSGVRTERIRYASSTGQTVTGVLVGPPKRAGLPGLIWLGPSPAVVDRAQAIARLGAIVISIDPPQVRRTGELQLTFSPADRDELIELMIELRRAVDVLLASGADPNRIAFIGYSWGAVMGATLSGIDHRLNGFVLMFAAGGLVEHLVETPDPSFGAGLTESQRDVWQAAMEPLESIYFVRHASPSWLFFQNGRHDEVIAEASARRLHDAASDPKIVEWYDSGHDPTPNAPEVWCDQAKWLQEQLEISSSAVEECLQV